MRGLLTDQAPAVGWFLLWGGLPTIGIYTFPGGWHRRFSGVMVAVRFGRLGKSSVWRRHERFFASLLRRFCRLLLLPCNTDDFAKESNRMAGSTPQNRRCHPRLLTDQAPAAGWFLLWGGLPTAPPLGGFSRRLFAGIRLTQPSARSCVTSAFPAGKVAAGQADTSSRSV